MVRKLSSAGVQWRDPRHKQAQMAARAGSAERSLGAGSYETNQQEAGTSERGATAQPQAEH